VFQVRHTDVSRISAKALRWIGFSVLLTAPDIGPAHASAAPVITEHRGIRMEAVPNGVAAVSAADPAHSVAPEEALARLQEALDRIYGGSPLSASKIDQLKRNGRVVMIYDPAFPKERLASVTIAAFFPDYYQHQGAMKDFIVVVGRYGIKWPRDKLAAIIVHELVGHGLQHLRGRTDRDRKIDRECEARLYEEAAYQDFRLPRATPQMIRFRKDMERNWCADFRLFMRRQKPQSMALWNYGTPKVPELLAVFEEYLAHLRASGEAGRAVSASAAKRHREFLAFAREAERTKEPGQLFVVGKKYLHGVGVDKDVDRARDWFRKYAGAADIGRDGGNGRRCAAEYYGRVLLVQTRRPARLRDCERPGRSARAAAVAPSAQRRPRPRRAMAGRSWAVSRTLPEGRRRNFPVACSCRTREAPAGGRLNLFRPAPRC